MNEPKYLRKNENELLLPIIPHKIDGSLIEQRATDGYINATAICKACGKELSNYLKNQSTNEFLEELSSVLLIRRTELIQKIQGGIPQLQGTWVHPDVSINLAQWASPKFAVFVSKWVREEKKLEPNDFPTYTHTYPDGRKVPNVKLYPNELLADFRKHFNEVWMIKRCLKYFSDRDENSIPHIKQLIQSLPEYKENKKIN